MDGCFAFVYRDRPLCDWVEKFRNSAARVDCSRSIEANNKKRVSQTSRIFRLRRCLKLAEKKSGFICLLLFG